MHWPCPDDSKNNKSPLKHLKVAGGGLCDYRVSSLALAKSLTIKPSEKSVGTINSFPLINRLT